MKHKKKRDLPTDPPLAGAPTDRATLGVPAKSPANAPANTPDAGHEPWDPSASGSRRSPFAPEPRRLLPPTRADHPGAKHEAAVYEDQDEAVPFGSEVDFIELIAQTNFSFLQGASHPEEMVLRAKQLRYRGIAICDTNGFYGVVRGYQAAKKPSHFDAEQLKYAENDENFDYICGAILTPYDASPVALLPMTKDGYSQISRLVTKAKRKSPKGEITLSLKEICEEPEDIIAFPLPPWTNEHLRQLKDAFNDRVYLPVCKDFTWESVRLYHQALEIEHDLGILPFATQRPLFHHPDRKPLHDVVTCILHRTTIDEAGTRLTLNRERYMKSPDHLAQLFSERPDMLSRTLEIAARITFQLTELRYKYPQENLPPGKTAPEYLRELVEAGIRERYEKKIDEAKMLPAGSKELKILSFFLRRVRKQADEELAIIAELGYEDYFITLKEICIFADSKGILYQGRGSAANSIVCYALKLTSVCPIEMNLMFGRFISVRRGEPPDIDIDFEHARREEVIQHIYTKYGPSRAAMVCVVVCYRSRMAIREVAKVMGLELWQIDALVKFMGREGLSRLVDEQMQPHVQVLQEPEDHAPVTEDPKSPDHGSVFDLKKIGLSPDRFQKLLHLALAMQGFPRHLGIHSGGFVISHEALTDIVPVESATKDDRYVIQWNKDDISTLGLMKLDMLSLGMLTAVKKTLDLLRKHRDVHWDMSQFPPDDAATYDMICLADTIGVFQIESRAQMSLLPRLRPRKYYDLVVEVAIVRPGPIVGGMVHPYLKRRHGLEEPTYEHDALKPILQRTYGVPLFQEQVMQIAVDVAGFTPGEADELRRVVSSAWKKKAVMNGLRQSVINGMMKNKVSQEYAEQIYKVIEGFSSYGFPESHAASFAHITYVSCYIKKHHPDMFACALLNSQPMGFYSPRQLIADAQRHGVKFHALDVQWSLWEYCLVDPWTEEHFENPPPSYDKPSKEAREQSRESTTFATAPLDVRVGFTSVYGLKREQIERFIEERKVNGLYRDLTDFIRRTKLPKATLIRLAAAGALQTVHGFVPRESMWAIQGLTFDEKSLFFGAHSGLDEERSLAETLQVPKESEWSTVQREYSAKGFSLETHPLKVLRPQLEASSKKYTTAADLKKLRNRTRVNVAGLISLLQRPPTAKGMAFASIEDETGIMNIVITPDIYTKYRLVMMGQPLLEFEGVLEAHQGVYNVKAQSIRALTKTNLPSRLTAGEVSYGKNV